MDTQKNTTKQGRNTQLLRRELITILIVLCAMSIWFGLGSERKIETEDKTIDGINSTTTDITSKETTDVTVPSTHADPPFEPSKETIVRIPDGANSQTLDGETIYVDKDPNIEKGLLEPLVPNNLEKLSPYYYRDSKAQKVYSLREELGENVKRVEIIKNADPKTFSVYKDDARYAFDLKNVHAVFAEPFTSLYEAGIIERADQNTFEPSIVKAFAIPQGNTFQGWISRDKNNVYYKYDAIESADPKSFKLTEHISINTDKNNVYLWYKVIPAADPMTYEVLHDTSASQRGIVYGRDKNNLFVDYCLVEAVDGASTKKVLNSTGLFKISFSDKKGNFTVEYDQSKNTCKANRE